MAQVVKTQADLELPVELRQLRGHLLTEAPNPPTRPETIWRVGCWIATDELGEVGETTWFEVNGNVAKAQSVINAEVVPLLRERFKAEVKAEVKEAKSEAPPAPAKLK